jgi:hypothetical protein
LALAWPNVCDFCDCFLDLHKSWIQQMKDQSHLPVAEQSLVFRLRKRAEIRRQIKDRKSVQEGTPDRIADLLEEAADELERLQAMQQP